MEINKLKISEDLETAVDAALTVLRNGGSARASDKVFNYIIKNNEVKEADLILRTDNISACIKSGNEYISISKSVGDIAPNLSKVSELINLADYNIKTDFKAEVDKVNNFPDLYSKGLRIFMTGLAAACFSRLAGCGWDVFPFVFIAGIAGQFVHLFLAKKRDTVSFTDFVAAICASMITAAGVKAGFGKESIVPMFISSICYIVPGVVLVFGFFDTLSVKYFSIGVERIIFATLIFFILFIALFISKLILNI